MSYQLTHKSYYITNNDDNDDDDDNNYSREEDAREPRNGLFKTLLRTGPNEGRSMGVCLNEVPSTSKLSYARRATLSSWSKAEVSTLKQCKRSPKHPNNWLSIADVDRLSTVEPLHRKPPSNRVFAWRNHRPSV